MALLEEIRDQKEEEIHLRWIATIGAATAAVFFGILAFFFHPALITFSLVLVAVACALAVDTIGRSRRI